VLTKTSLPGEVAVSCGYAHSLDGIMGVWYNRKQVTDAAALATPGPRRSLGNADFRSAICNQAGINDARQ